MSEVLFFLIVAAGGALTAQNAVVGYFTGKIEMRSVSVDRLRQPMLFWFVLTTEAFFVGAAIWLFVGWLTGNFKIEGN